jgi:hypothetical protein
VTALRWILVAGLLAGCSARKERGGIGSIAAERVVPLATVEFSGHRYVARVDVGLGESVPLMIHGNSRMFLSLTHPVGAKLNRGPIKAMERYGYSANGKGVLRVERIRLGGETFARIPAVPVFDFTEDGDTTVQGMLGVPFLAMSRAAVDFSRDLLLLGVAPNADPNRSLLARGYRSVPILVLASGRVTLDARFPALDRVLPITPSTVANALTLHAPLFANRVPMTRAPSPDRSPSGTAPDEYVCDRVDFEIGGARFHSPAKFEDFAEYGNVPEREVESFGYLGFDWMKEHRAILDYANRRLYFRP